MIANQDALAYLRTLPDSSVDALVTDPPAGIGFMGKEWDKDKGGRDHWVAWLAEIMREALRVLKPGAHGLVWALPRTSHWTATALEDAGFEVRDRVTHLFGTGFPKSLDVSKAIDKAAGAEREVIGKTRGGVEAGGKYGCSALDEDQKWHNVTAPATEAARQWDGWGTALKPAAEDWWLVRKPLIGTVAANVQEWGTGAINVDGCRIGTTVETWPRSRSYAPGQIQPGGKGLTQKTGDIPAGRWPANVTLDEEAAAVLDAQAGESKSSGGAGPNSGKLGYHGGGSGNVGSSAGGFGDSGGASRFFYVAKPSTAERSAGLPAGDRSTHPTVKSIALMRWLVRLITPPGGTVLDCFVGSGTTGCACVLEGFRFVGCEQDSEFAALAEARIAHHAVQAQGRLL